MVQNIQIEKLVNSYHLSFFFSHCGCGCDKVETFFGGFQTVCIQFTWQSLQKTECQGFEKRG